MTTGTVLRVSRPTILLGGQESPGLGQALLAMRIEETADGIAHAELSVGNWGPVGDRTDFLYFDRRDVDFGKDLVIRLGERDLFRGRITGLEGQFPEGSPPTLGILAEDRLQDLRMTRRTRTFEQQTDEQVIRRIAGDHGLTADVRLDGPTHRVIAQLNQSDLAFVRDRCRLLDAEVWVDDRTLAVRRRADRGGTPTDLGYGNQLREVTILADLVDQASTVIVGGWDVAAKEAISERATSAALGAELGQTDAGASILSRAFADRTQVHAHEGPVTTSEARSAAEAHFRRRARRFVRATGLAETSPDLRPGRFVNLTGLGPLLSGRYYVTETRDVFDAVLGLRTEFAAERPGLGRP